MDKQIGHLLSRMTLEENVSMAAGKEAWCGTGVERRVAGRELQA